MKARKASVKRKTKETNIAIEVNLDGTGKYSVTTGIPFFDHMLELFSRHSLIDLKIKATGDIQVDYHHTVEDIGLALGTVIDKALGTRKGIRRYGWCVLPMDEALSRAAVDLGGRPFLVLNKKCKKRKIMEFDLSLIEEFFIALTVQARMNLNISQLEGNEPHHAYESIFKAFARSLRMAVEADPRDKRIPSSKGKI